jgi:hypothetical protein
VPDSESELAVVSRVQRFCTSDGDLRLARLAGKNLQRPLGEAHGDPTSRKRLKVLNALELLALPEPITTQCVVSADPMAVVGPGNDDRPILGE